MSNKFDYKSGLRERNNVSLPVADATLIEVGDHIKLTAGLCVVGNVAGDDTEVIAIAVEAKKANVAGVNGKITVSLLDGISRYERDVDAPSTWVAGDTFQISGKQELSKNAALPVAMAVAPGTSASRVLVVYLKSQKL